MPSTQGSSGNGAGAWQPTPSPPRGQRGHVTAHLLVFQQDQAHNGYVDGVPDAGVMEKAGHLREGRRLSAWAWDTGSHRPTPTPTRTCLPTQGSSQRTQLHTRQCTRVRRPVKVPISLALLQEGLPTQPQGRRPCCAQNRAGKPPALLKLSQHKASPHMGTRVRFWGAEMAGQASCELASSNSVKKNNIRIGMDKAFTIKS